jgi:hypothetical protein
MPIGDSSKHLLEADSERAGDANDREEPEVPTPALEVREIAPAHGRPIGQRLLREVGQ